MASIFLSHAHTDKPFAQKLATDLRRHDHKVWIDEAEIQLGDSLIEKIRQGLDEVDHVAAILSEASINSQWVQKELDIAMNREIEHRRVVVLPLLLEDVDLPGFLKGKMYADFRDHGRYSEGLSLLLRRLGTTVTSSQAEDTIDESDGQPEHQRQPVSSALDETFSHKTEPPETMQKKNPPNTIINIARIGTLGSIGDITGNANVHIDHSLRPASTPMGRKPSPKDTELFERLLDLLPSTGVVQFYKEHNFLGAFEKQFVDPLYEFIDNWDNPEHEFLYKELEKARCELYESAKALGTTIAKNTVPNRAGQISVKPDSLPSDQTPDWVKRDAQEINDLAPPFVKKHVQFVRLGRRILYG